MIVYKATNRVTGKCYVGITQQRLLRRMADHRNKAADLCTPFARSIQKHGFDAFEWVVLQSATTRAELASAEKDWIQHLSCIAPHGYNVTAGGDGGLPGVRRSDNTRNKIRVALKGRTHSDERLAAIRTAMQGVDYFRMCKKNSTSGVTGVSFDPRRCKWAAYINPQRKKVNLGRYEDFFEAVCARKSAEARL